VVSGAEVLSRENNTVSSKETENSRQGASTQYAGKTSEGEKVLSGGQSTMPTQRKGYRGYRDLKVYQLALEIHELTKQFPKEEKYALTDQIRKSSRSVPANLAEAWKKRRYKKAFISKLTDSAGEAGETEAWLDFSNDF